MQFLDAMLSIANHTRFAEETHKLEVIEAITTALTVPEPTESDDAGTEPNFDGS